MSLKILDIKNAVMTTDLYISLYSETHTEKELEVDIEFCVSELKSFEHKYSRFIKDNELYVLNNSSDVVVSEELFKILSLCSDYYHKTQGLFDPTIYSSLLKEGYTVSKDANFSEITSNSSSFLNSSKIATTKDFSFDLIELKAGNKVVKPLDLKIDLGGIGKGFVIDKLTAILKKKYTDFCISLGGDMYIPGVDRENDYPYWAINIEDPFFGANISIDLPTLLLLDKAVATSGVNKRTWLKGGVRKNHLINPHSYSSVSNSLICVTVIRDTVVDADIMAKTLLLLGLEEGLNYCKINSIPAVFVSKKTEVFFSDNIYDYIWKP